MRQAVVTEPGTLIFQQVAAPHELGAKDVLLKIKTIGICGSDIHVFHGEHPAVIYPVVQGHEYAGEIVQVGSELDPALVGRIATARPQLVCGKCGPCQRGQYNICQELKVQGFQAPGVAQDLFVTHLDRLVILPEQMTSEAGAFIEPVAVAVHACSRAGSLIGQRVVVAGAGPIGNLIAQVARLKGAKEVLITDINDFRLQIAEKCGVDHTVNVANQPFLEGIQRAFGESGFRVAFEVAGVQSALEDLMAHIEKGSEVIIVGVYGKNPVVNMFHLGEHELQLKGSLMYLHEDYLEAARLIAEGSIVLEPLVTKRFRFEEFNDAYLHIQNERDTTLKVLINL